MKNEIMAFSEATLSTLPRHPVLKEQGSEYLERVKHEFELNKELGLGGQIYEQARQSLKGDYDQLVKDKGYIEVTKPDMEALFQVNRLLLLCRLINIGRGLKAFADSLWIHFLFAAIGAAICFFGGVKIPQMWNLIPIVSGGCVAGLALVMGLSKLMDGIKWKTLTVNLKTEDLQTTRHRLPYGALLRVKEAKDAGIFKKFIYLFPHVTEEEAEVKFRLDPAICGVAEIDNEEVWYLITYWDIKHDIESARKKILKKVRPLKLV